MEKKENEATVMFLNNIANEVEKNRNLSKEDVNRLKNIFTQKKFSGIEKCCYNLVIKLGMSGNPELRTLASEFNVILNNACK